MLGLDVCAAYVACVRGVCVRDHSVGNGAWGGHYRGMPSHGPSVMIIAAREPSAGKELQRARLAQHCMYPAD